MNVYSCIFVIAFSTLALEVTLVRLLSVVTWYHLAFFSISTAMLGMTAGAVRVYLRPEEFERSVRDRTVSTACVRYALAVPVTLILLCLLPLGLYMSVMSPLALLIATLACSLPFYFSGIAVTALLTKYPQPIGKIYASDLIGASLGCLFVLGGLEILDAPSLILLCGSGGALAGLILVWSQASAKRARLYLLLTVGFIVLAALNSRTFYGIRPVLVKTRLEAPAEKYLLEKWNSFSRVALYKETVGSPQYWGPSPIAPMDPVRQYKMNIDGEAGTYVRRFASMSDIDHLRFDVTNVGYFLNRGGPACIIGLGGGRDLQSALLFGHSPVVGIDINGIFIDVLQNQFREFAGLGNRENVLMIRDDARSYLSRMDDTYSVIQMSLIDTWASTGAGAYSLSENGLYTVEAWTVFLSRLNDDGFFTVSRWHSPENIGETGRVLSLAVATLLDLGVERPADHLALIGTDRVSTLLLSRRPFSVEDLATLDRVCGTYEYHSIHLPGEPPEDPTLRSILSAQSRSQLAEAVSNTRLNYDPPTDENPYFFNMLKFSSLGVSLAPTGEGVYGGNLRATLTLLVLLLALFIVTLVIIVFPLVMRGGKNLGEGGMLGAFWPGAVYFCLIGAGFMLFEIALIQRLTIFLGHPMYGLGILLFTLIASTGVGSYISNYLPLTRTPWIFLLPVVVAAAIVMNRLLLGVLIPNYITEATLTKIIVSVLAIFPFGILLGFFFPTGMSIFKNVCPGATPWYWGLNGITGVLSSAIAVLISIYSGVSNNFFIAAVCYLAVTLPLFRLYRAGMLEKRVS